MAVMFAPAHPGCAGVGEGGVLWHPERVYETSALEGRRGHEAGEEGMRNGGHVLEGKQGGGGSRRKRWGARLN